MKSLKKALQLEIPQKIPFYDSVFFCFENKPKTFKEYVEMSIKYGLNLGFDGIPILDTPYKYFKSLIDYKNRKINKSILHEIIKALTEVKNNQIALGFVLKGPLISNYLIDKSVLEKMYLSPLETKQKIKSHNSLLLEVTKSLEGLIDFFVFVDPISSNSLISPEHFYEFCLPSYSQIYEDCHTPIVLHSPGKIFGNLESIIQSGIKGLQPLDSDDIKLVTQKTKGRLCLIGNINNELIANGSEEEIYSEVKRCIKSFRENKTPFILHSNFWIKNNTPKEKIKIILDLIN